MKAMPGKAYDLAIVDPPYGIGEDGSNNHTRGHLCEAKRYTRKGWDDEAPPVEYFKELQRVSVNQIIFGANHFIDRVPIPSSCWIVWDKVNYGNDFSDCELALTSFKTSVRKFTFQWNGMLQGDMKHKEKRIHPTQKPAALYRWLLSKYAKPGDKILDTHGGSGSICIACHDLGFDLDWYEIDAEYFQAAKERTERHQRQVCLPLEIRPAEETVPLFGEGIG
jgi:site-specific DNA-methyltransferase (adenine-specific)